MYKRLLSIFTILLIIIIGFSEKELFIHLIKEGGRTAIIMSIILVAICVFFFQSFHFRYWLERSVPFLGLHREYVFRLQDRWLVQCAFSSCAGMDLKTGLRRN